MPQQIAVVQPARQPERVDVEVRVNQPVAAVDYSSKIVNTDDLEIPAFIRRRQIR